jgi:C4-dicarboxylate-binding protein DctP
MKLSSNGHPLAMRGIFILRRCADGRDDQAVRLEQGREIRPRTGTAIRRLVALAAAGLALLSAPVAPAAGSAVPVMRISTENSAGHFQTRIVARFAERLRDRLAGQLMVEHRFDAELYRDREVIQAVSRGNVEMAVPGTWQFDRFEPSVGVFLLPMFYGRTSEVNYRLRDGPIGREINHRIEAHLGVSVPGRWIDLGYVHLYGVGARIAAHDDIAGKRVRVAGGLANVLRLEAFGATPMTIPWPDLPEALKKRRVDGILTSNATVVSARLWDYGVNSTLQDQEYFAQYIPIISEAFWRRLPEPVRTAIVETWDGVVDEARATAAAAQDEALATLVAHGITVSSPSPGTLADRRHRLIRHQDAMAVRLGIDPAFVKRVSDALGE